MATDLATMKARIARELGNRTDLTTEIGEAINDAISVYQNDRFYFNEQRLTFNTVNGQEFYTSADLSNIPDLLEIDYIMKVVGNNVIEMSYVLPKTMEDIANVSSFIGEPYNWTYYNQQIRLFPIPNLVIAIRIGAHVKLAGPTLDTDATNPWIIQAERLIRSRAKYQLSVHKTLNADMANAMSPDTGEAYRAFNELKGRTNVQTAIGTLEASSF